MICTQIALAQQPTQLKSEIDDLKITLTTDWDGKDQAFLHKTTQDFAKKISDLGISQDELVQALKDEAQGTGVELKVNQTLSAMNTQQLSLIQIQELLLKDARMMSKSGANWNGESSGKVAFVVLLSAIALGSFTYSMYNITQD